MSERALGSMMTPVPLWQSLAHVAHGARCMRDSMVARMSCPRPGRAWLYSVLVLVPDDMASERGDSAQCAV